MDVKALEYNRLSQETWAHDEELPAALENHNAIHPFRESKHVKANENFWIKFPMNKNGWMNSQKEIKILQKVVDTMKVQLNELQMCKLKLERQVKIWTN